MTVSYDERWPVVSQALQLAKAGNPEVVVEMLESYILEQKDHLSWSLYFAAYWLELLQHSDSEKVVECPKSESIFNQLVPEHISKADLAKRLSAETENFLMLYQEARNLDLPKTCEYVVTLEAAEWGRAFRDNLRVFSEEEFVNLVWLEDGYTKWVDLSLLETNERTTFIIARVGGRVETFRDVYHHDEGYAPFRTR